LKNKAKVKAILDKACNRYNKPDFIKDDPISIPHLFNKKQDIEIMGFFAAILAWGRRSTIINKCHELIERMDHQPYDFVCGATDREMQRIPGFKHRTFKDIDLLYFLSFLSFHYHKHESLESAFTKPLKSSDKNVSPALIHFKSYFFSLEHPERTKKHISSPETNSSCKRLNMFLRWMVRKDEKGVDFGIWKGITPSQLLCPLDVHVARSARNLGLLNRKYNDYKAVIELSDNLRQLDPEDPVRYDFALFGLSMNDLNDKTLKLI
jgi:uncharacterized protein (TIGR02757 family)